MRLKKVMATGLVAALALSTMVGQFRPEEDRSRSVSRT